MLPTEIKVILAAFIGFLVTEGLKVVGGWLKADLSGVGAGIAASISTAVVLFAESLLALVPAQYAGTVGAIFGLIVALLGAFGVYKQAKSMRVQ